MSFIQRVSQEVYSKDTIGMMKQDTLDYQKLFLENIPLMDVRAPVEFLKGAFPCSQNTPLLDNKQREMIGTHYKQQGQDAAIALGLKLATPEIREQRLSQWRRFIEAHPEGYLYCFRGGLRSRTTQAWLKEQGIDYPLIQGGYKAMRTFLLQQLEVSAAQTPFVILSGLTGSGKTRLLYKTQYQVDLEGLSNHRGSAFGGEVNGLQPMQIDWENKLSIACLQYRHRFPQAGLLLEDEGKQIGRNVMPLCFYEKMKQAPVVLLECDLDARVGIIREDYIASSWPLYQQKYAAEARQKFSSFVLDNLLKIKKRLGGVLYTKIDASFRLALEKLFATGQSDLFDEGIALLLEKYYDPMYRYQLEKKVSRVTFKGPEADVLAWVNEHLKDMDH
tara:strand:+ start:290 stop:1456 length:1167 start_codon:yes stop_codon:yes gene_type:complete